MGGVFFKHPKQQYRDSSIKTMITIATNNLSPTIYSSGFSSQRPPYLPTLPILTTKQTPFMQNKPNFQKSQVHLTITISKSCAKMDTWSQGKNKPNQNQFQTQIRFSDGFYIRRMHPSMGKTAQNSLPDTVFAL